jgi:hypothetical protein
MTELERLVEWFTDRYYGEVPLRLTSRDIADDGAPNWSRAFYRYVTHTGKPQIIEEQEACPRHAMPCDFCDGSGLRRRERLVDPFPMKSALWRVGKVPVPKGRPDFRAVLLVLASNMGNVALASAALAADCAYMADQRMATLWILTALKKVKAAYREDVPARVLRKSEAQSIAEAA